MYTTAMCILTIWYMFVYIYSESLEAIQAQTQLVSCLVWCVVSHTKPGGTVLGGFGVNTTGS